MAADPRRYQRAPLVNDAEALLLYVRRMTGETFARTFRNGLTSQQLMTVVTALPTGRLEDLMDGARSRLSPDSPAAAPPPNPDAPLARALRFARADAKLSQAALAERVGVRQATVTQWEHGVTAPDAKHLLDLGRVLPTLAERLGTLSGRPGTAAAAR